MSSSLTPRKITSLCAKEVISVAYGSGPHLLALTKGKNEFSPYIKLGLARGWGWFFRHPEGGAEGGGRTQPQTLTLKKVTR